MNLEIWRKQRVLMTISMGNTWLYESIAKGEFPAPVKLGARAVGWRRADVEGWLASREKIGKTQAIQAAKSNKVDAQKDMRNGKG